MAHPQILIMTTPRLHFENLHTRVYNNMEEEEGVVILTSGESSLIQEDESDIEDSLEEEDDFEEELDLPEELEENILSVIAGDYGTEEVTVSPLLIESNDTPSISLSGEVETGMKRRREFINEEFTDDLIFKTKIMRQEEDNEESGEKKEERKEEEGRDEWKEEDERDEEQEEDERDEEQEEDEQDEEQEEDEQDEEDEEQEEDEQDEEQEEDEQDEEQEEDVQDEGEDVTQKQDSQIQRIHKVK